MSQHGDEDREINRAKDKLNRLHLSIVARQQKLNRLLNSYYAEVANSPYSNEPLETK